VAGHADVILITPLGLYVASALTAFYMHWVGRHGWPAIALCADRHPLLVFWCSRPGSWSDAQGPLEAWLGYDP